MSATRLLAVLSLFISACSSSQEDITFDINDSVVTPEVSFRREFYFKRFYFLDNSHRKRIEISCYSLNDEAREEFAEKNKTDPVADLSCYVRDTRRENEFTMLGLDGESLQYTPAFFWFSDVSKCSSSSYRMDAWVRGISISFVFSDIDVNNLSADMIVSVKEHPQANNDRLTEENVRVGCT